MKKKSEARKALLKSFNEAPEIFSMYWIITKARFRSNYKYSESTLERILRDMRQQKEVGYSYIVGQKRFKKTV